MSVRSILPAVLVTAASLVVAGPASAGGWSGVRGGPAGGGIAFHAPAPHVLGAVSAASHIRPVITPHPMGFNGPIGLYVGRGRGGYVRHGAVVVGGATRVYGRNVWHGGFNGPIGWRGAYGYGVWHRPYMGRFGRYHPARRYHGDYAYGGYGYGNYASGGYVGAGDYGYGMQVVNGVGVVGGATVYPVYGSNACGGGPAIYELNAPRHRPHRDPLVIYGIAPQCGGAPPY